MTFYCPVMKNINFVFCVFKLMSIQNIKDFNVINVVILFLKRNFRVF